MQCQHLNNEILCAEVKYLMGKSMKDTWVTVTMTACGLHEWATLLLDRRYLWPATRKIPRVYNVMKQIPWPQTGHRASTDGTLVLSLACDLEHRQMLLTLAFSCSRSYPRTHFPWNCPVWDLRELGSECLILPWPAGFHITCCRVNNFQLSSKRGQGPVCFIFGTLSSMWEASVVLF
jgi:hypothetical protein